MLRRKIDKFLIDWKNNKDHQPLIVFGARQIGKSTSIHNFIINNYENVIEIDFKKQPEYKSIFKEGYEPDKILKAISIINPNLKAIPYKTIIFF